MLYTRKEINVSTSACKKSCTDRGIRGGIRTGLNILTGETGAGKSILLGSIQLILGGKTSRSMIRENASYALVELLFQVENTKARESLAALDIYPEDGQVLMSRKIMDGRSINKINGETSTVSQMKAAAAVFWTFTDSMSISRFFTETASWLFWMYTERTDPSCQGEGPESISGVSGLCGSAESTGYG